MRSGHLSSEAARRLTLDDAAGHDAHAVLGDQLDRDARGRVGRLEVVDELRQVLDGVDVVVRRRADEADAGGAVAGASDVALDLRARQLAALARLGALRDLDLQLVRVPVGATWRRQGLGLWRPPLELWAKTLKPC